MIHLIDAAIKDRLESLSDDAKTAVYADLESASKRYAERLVQQSSIETSSAEVKLPFFSFLCTGISPEMKLFGRPTMTRGLRESVLGDSTSYSLKKVIPVRLTYQIAAFAKSMRQMQELQQDLFFWIMGLGSITFEYATDKSITVAVGFIESVSNSESTGFTLKKYEVGKFYASVVELGVAGFLTKDDTVKTILEINTQFYDGLYGGENVLMSSYQRTAIV